MTPEAWKEQAAHTVSESGAASDWEHALKIGADLYPLVQQAIAAERDKALQEAAGIAETYSWQDGKMTENSCCAATGCDIAAAIRQMKGEG